MWHLRALRNAFCRAGSDCKKSESDSAAKTFGKSAGGAMIEVCQEEVKLLDAASTLCVPMDYAACEHAENTNGAIHSFQSR